MNIKLWLILLLLVSAASCGGGGGNSGGGNTGNAAKTAVMTDLTADMAISGQGTSRSVRIGFYISQPVAPGVKTAPKVEVVKADEARFNDTVLTETDAGGRPVYAAQDVTLQAENVISMKHNGKQYEGKFVPLGTADSTSINITMMPK